jgi:ankyrin repeat protein
MTKWHRYAATGDNGKLPTFWVQYRDFVQQDNKLRLPLHYAAEYGRANAVKHLLEIMKDEDIIKTDIDGKCAFHDAVFLGQVSAAECLLERMSSEQLGMKDKGGRTALHLAILNRPYFEGRDYISFIELLLEKMTHQNLAIKDNNSKTALHYAVRIPGPAAATVTNLIIKRMKPDGIAIQDNDGKTALHYAVIMATAKVTDLLLKDMHLDGLALKDKIGRNVFHYAVTRKDEGCQLIVKALIDLLPYEHLNARDKHGRNACSYLVMANACNVSREILHLVRMAYGGLDAGFPNDYPYVGREGWEGGAAWHTAANDPAFLSGHAGSTGGLDVPLDGDSGGG